MKSNRALCCFLLCLCCLPVFVCPSLAAGGDPPAVLTVNLAPGVSVSAKAWLLMDASTGTVLAENNADERIEGAIEEVLEGCQW